MLIGGHRSLLPQQGQWDVADAGYNVVLNGTLIPAVGGRARIQARVALHPFVQIFLDGLLSLGFSEAAKVGGCSLVFISASCSEASFFVANPPLE